MSHNLPRYVLDGEPVVVLTVQQASVLKGAAQLGLAFLDRQRGGHAHLGSEECPLRLAIAEIRAQFEALVRCPGTGKSGPVDGAG